MKTIRLLCMVVGAALLLLSCYLTSNQATGKIIVSAGSQSRSITSGSGLIRISLFSLKNVNGTLIGGSLYTFSGGLTYTEATVGSTVTLSNIPIGTWAVLVAAGSKPDGKDFVTTDYNYPYTAVQVAPGVDNPVSVNLNRNNEVNPVITGTDMAGVTSVGGTICAVSSNQLYDSSKTFAGTSLPAGNANSVSLGYSPTDGTTPVAYVNTSAGIYYYDTSSQNFPPTTQYLANTNPISILDSAAFTSSGTGYLFYENATGLGGVSFNSLTPPSSSAWKKFDTSNIVAGKPINDFTVSSAYGYFASKLGAFQLNSSVLSSGGSINILDKTTTKFFTVTDDSVILSVNVTGANLYIGSSTGAWTATLNEAATPPFTSLTKKPETAGDSIVRIAATTAGPGYVAFLSQYNLYIYKTGGSEKTYPFYSGLPGQLTAMAWNSSGSALYVSGTASTSTGAPGGLVTISGAGLP